MYKILDSQVVLIYGEQSGRPKYLREKWEIKDKAFFFLTFLHFWHKAIWQLASWAPISLLGALFSVVKEDKPNRLYLWSDLNKWLCPSVQYENRPAERLSLFGALFSDTNQHIQIYINYLIFLQNLINDKNASPVSSVCIDQDWEGVKHAFFALSREEQLVNIFINRS